MAKGKDPMTDEEIEHAAIWLRSQYFGTDYPQVAWHDASESEREAWLRLAGKEPEFTWSSDEVNQA